MHTILHKERETTCYRVVSPAQFREKVKPVSNGLANQTLYRLMPTRMEGSGHSCIHFWCPEMLLLLCGISV